MSDGETGRTLAEHARAPRLPQWRQRATLDRLVSADPAGSRQPVRLTPGRSQSLLDPGFVLLPEATQPHEEGRRLPVRAQGNPRHGRWEWTSAQQRGFPRLIQLHRERVSPNKDRDATAHEGEAESPRDHTARGLGEGNGVRGRATRLSGATALEPEGQGQAIPAPDVTTNTPELVIEEMLPTGHARQVESRARARHSAARCSRWAWDHQHRVCRAHRRHTPPSTSGRGNATDGPDPQ